MMDSKQQVITRPNPTTAEGMRQIQTEFFIDSTREKIRDMIDKFTAAQIPLRDLQLMFDDVIREQTQ